MKIHAFLQAIAQHKFELLADQGPISDYFAELVFNDFTMQNASSASNNNF